MSNITNPVKSATQSPILKNAISTLRIGLEDYELSKKDPDRTLSSTRNVYASLLLFLKEGLCRLSPMEPSEGIIKSQLQPILQADNSLGVIGIGEKTIDVEGIQARYKLLNMKIEWKTLLSIQKERNNIEHYYSASKIEVLQSVICKASTFIIEILKKVFNTDPVSLLGPVWEQMVKIKEIYEKMKEDCDSSFEILHKKKLFSEELVSHIKDVACPHCHSQLLYLFTGEEKPSKKISIKLEKKEECKLICYACHENLALGEAFAIYANEDFDPSYTEYRYGAQPIVKICPECGFKTFIDNQEVDACIFCGHKKMNKFCNVCEEPLPIERDFEGICEHCEYMLSEP